MYGCCSHRHNRPPLEEMAQIRSLFDDVKKELECPVCQEHFSQINESKILKCLHTFCKTCLEAWVRQHREGQLSYPTCRQITECPNSNINSVSSNLFYKQMVEIMEAYSGRGEEDSSQCGSGDEKKALKYYCFECNGFMCNKCVGIHKKGKFFSGHYVKDVRNFQSCDAQDYARTANYCTVPETHKGLKRVTLICLLCPMLVIIHFMEREEEITDQSNFVNNVTYLPSGSRARLKKWPINGGNTPESRESFQRLKPGILPKH